MAQQDDIAEIIMLTHRYARGVDQYDPAELVAVFAEDAVLDHSAFGLSRCVGRDEIVAYFNHSRASGRQSMHVITNHLVELIDRDGAVGSNYAQAFRPGPDGGQPLVAALALNTDEYVRAAHGWQIKSRVTTPVVDIGFDF